MKGSGLCRVKTKMTTKGNAPGRRRLREAVFTMIFQAEYHNECDADLLFSAFWEEMTGKTPLCPLYEDIAAAEGDAKVSADAYIRDTFLGVLSRKDELDEKIAAASVGWKKERLSKIILAILRLSVYEMLYTEDVAVSVAINEAVELTKRYEDVQMSAFVNGVLGKISRETTETK